MLTIEVDILQPRQARLLTPERLLWDSGDEWQRTATAEATGAPVEDGAGADGS